MRIISAAGSGLLRGLIRVVAVLFILFLSLVIIFPFYWMITSGLKTSLQVEAYPPLWFPFEMHWENFANILSGKVEGTGISFEVPFMQMFFNSVYVMVLTVLLALVVSTLAGYALARLKFPGRTVLLIGFGSALLMPITGLVIPLYIIFDALGWTGTHLPLILEPALGAPSIVGAFMMRQYFLGFPRELADAGKIDGLGHLGIFLRIALPLAKPAIASVVILTSLHSWNMFLEPLVFVGGSLEMQTVPVALTQFTNTQGTPVYEVQMAATTMSVLPVLIVFLIAQRQFVRGIATVGIRG